MFSAGVMSTNAVNIATTSKAKDKAAGGAGAQFFLGGILVLISTSWAASNIIKKNDPGYSYNPNQPIGNQGKNHFSMGASVSVAKTIDSDFLNSKQSH